MSLSVVLFQEVEDLELEEEVNNKMVMVVRKLLKASLKITLHPIS